MPMWKFFVLCVLFMYAFDLRVSAADTTDARNSISGSTLVQQGEPATIRWNCADALSVFMDGDSTSYPPTYSLRVIPSSSLTLRFRVVRSTDTSRMYWTVQVRKPDTLPVQRGGEIRSYSLPPEASVRPSHYYIGYDTRADISLATRLKILSVDAPDSLRSDNKENYVVRAALLDSNGNNIARIPTWNTGAHASVTCNSSIKSSLAQGNDAEWTLSQRHMIMTVCMDRSAFSQSYDSSLRSAVSNFTFFLGSGDRLSVVAYNKDLTTVCQPSGKDKLNNLADLFSGEAEGLSAIYRAANTCLNRFDSTKGYDNVLVIIAGGHDNASLIYTAEDVISKARARRARIMTIGIGDAVDTYTLQLLSSRTGGRSYFISESDVSSVTDILREINNGIHASYTFLVSGNTLTAGSCDVSRLRLELASAPALRDSLSILSESDFSIQSRQILCLFGYGQSTVNLSYLPNIRRLANLLRDNPDKKIELMSHTFDEGDEETSLSLSDDRVRAARKILIDSGVAPSVIRCRSISNLRPLYPYSLASWQAELNRNVEVRWLDPSLLPYELVIEYVESEREAQAAVQTWSKRSYKAYYEAVNIRNAPAFCVKLWGFDSEASALDAATLIKKKYNVNCRIE